MITSSVTRDDSLDDFLASYSESLRAGTPAPPDPPSIPREELRARKAAIELLHLAFVPPPSAVGRFALLAPLGRGGFGVVYRALDTATRREVALKLPHPGLHPGRLSREAECVAKLSHPNIVMLCDSCPDYLVSELCEGPTLSDFLTRHGAFPPRVAASLLVLLAGAVLHIHDRGVVHRDLKPANILLVESPQHSFAFGGGHYSPKITDFGLARLLDTEAVLTCDHAFLGSPSYMAPEQADGHSKHAGPSADIYSLGVILYELLAGRVPFSGEVASAVRRRVVEESAAPLPVTVPYEVRAICSRCLEKDPALRYGSAVDLVADLRRYLARGPTLLPTAWAIRAGWRWCRRHALIAGLLVGSSFLLVVVVILSSAGW